METAAEVQGGKRGLCYQPCMGRGDRCENKKAWAAIGRRLHVAGVNLSINGQIVRHVCLFILKYSVERSLFHKVKYNIQWSKRCNLKGEQSLGRTDRKEIEIKLLKLLLN